MRLCVWDHVFHWKHQPHPWSDFSLYSVRSGPVSGLSWKSFKRALPTIFLDPWQAEIGFRGARPRVPGLSQSPCSITDCTSQGLGPRPESRWRSQGLQTLRLSP